MFPPGCAKLATSPDPTGSLLLVMIGIVCVAFLAASVAGIPRAKIMSTSRTDKVFRQLVQPIQPSPGEPILDYKIFPLDVAELF